MKIAKIIYQEILYEAHGGDFLESPVRRLIEFIYREYPDQARYILRQPIWLNYEPSQYEQALIKVGAKRYRVGEPPKAEKEKILATATNLKQKQDATNSLSDHPKFSSREEAITWFCKLAAKAGVVAAYVSVDYKVLGLAFNTNTLIKTQHAEMNMIEQFADINQREGDAVFVSLQSCRMCAAGLVEWLRSGETPVYYLEAEKNLKNVKTALHQREFMLLHDQSE